LSIRKNFAARNLSPDENGGADLLDGNDACAVYVSDHPTFFCKVHAACVAKGAR
jgi:hypothetical protein